MKIYLAFILFGLTMANDRSKRFLLFPPTAPTRTQIIAGIGVPVALDFESVTMGYVLKAEYYLPDNTTIVEHYLNEPFNPITLAISSRRRRDALLDSSGDEIKKLRDSIANETKNIENNLSSRDHYEKYVVEAIEIGSGSNDNDVDEDNSEYNYEDDEQYTASDTAPNIASDTAVDYRTSKNDFSTARWKLFKGIEMIAESKGLVGRSCMLRSICETAHAPFSFNSGILGELMHIIMTPSSTGDTINDHSQNEYLRAEELGRSGEPCSKIFRECTTSVLDQFSGIYNTMENVIKMFG